jgi:hypothetical protein
MRAGEGDCLEVLVGVDAIALQEEARHQVARGRRGRAEREVLALQIRQRLGRAVYRHDEFAGELLVFCTLHDRHHAAVGAQLRLHVGEAAEPRHVDLVVGQAFDHGGIVGHGCELHIEPGFLLQVVAQRLELALQLGGRFVGDGGDAQGADRLRLGGAEGEQQGEDQGIFHGCVWRRSSTA